MRIRVVIAGFMALALFSACRSTKSIAKQETQTAVPENSGVKSLIAAVQQNQPTFSTANVNKMTMEITMGERTVNVSASAKIRKDSAMHVSFQVFGFEVFRAEMTPDSIRVFDKTSRKYYVTDYGFLSQQFGLDVDYYSLQSLLTAQLFCMGKRNVNADSCKAEPGTEGTTNILYSNAQIAQTTTLTAEKLISKVLLSAVAQNYKMEAAYSDYANINGVNFPKEISMNASNDHSKASFKISILKAEFNTALKFQPMSADRYTRGDISRMLKKS